MCMTSCVFERCRSPSLASSFARSSSACRVLASRCSCSKLTSWCATCSCMAVSRTAASAAAARASPSNSMRPISSESTRHTTPKAASPPTPPLATFARLAAPARLTVSVGGGGRGGEGTTRARRENESARREGEEAGGFSGVAAGVAVGVAAGEGEPIARMLENAARSWECEAMPTPRSWVGEAGRAARAQEPSALQRPLPSEASEATVPVALVVMVVAGEGVAIGSRRAQPGAQRRGETAPWAALAPFLGDAIGGAAGGGHEGRPVTAATTATKRRSSANPIASVAPSASRRASSAVTRLEDGKSGNASSASRGGRLRAVRTATSSRQARTRAARDRVVLSEGALSYRPLTRAITSPHNASICCSCARAAAA